MSQNPSTAVGQVSADGQFRWDGTQWVPIPRGAREPTSWTRPMQLAAASLLAVDAIVTVATYLIFYTHDAVKKVFDASGSQLPQGSSEDQVITFTIVGAIAFAVFLALLELFGALGAVLRWRWVFWYVLVLMGLGSLGGVIGIFGLFRTGNSPFPIGVVILQELLSLAAIPMFVWMLIGVITRGPWAMKRPGT
ncbi:MAG: hypothetical protein E6I21_02565 [Chloroflexi bacterium]|nr:MAG: hypothetical protein E6I21_02565 [Chloroflexota bacterium]